ncbi:MAG: hypothetical protein R3A48_14195 [Polyangiales bacterium]
MSKNGMSEFIREAIREKATRDLIALNQRAHAFGGIDRSRDALFTVAGDLATATSAVSAVSADAAVASKFKKLRKLIDDAHVIATEIADALGTDAQRESLNAQREAVTEALRAAGIDPQSLSENPASS